jgi:hypothetical protein
MFNITAKIMGAEAVDMRVASLAEAARALSLPASLEGYAVKVNGNTIDPKAVGSFRLENDQFVMFSKAAKGA